MKTNNTFVDFTGYPTPVVKKKLFPGILQFLLSLHFFQSENTTEWIIYEIFA